MENNFDQLMNSGYTVLLEKKIPWPNEFTVQHKIALYSKFLEYYQEVEDYRKCIELSKKIKSLTKAPKVKSAKDIVNML
jgi:hypothetical protein